MKIIFDRRFLITSAAFVSGITGLNMIVMLFNGISSYPVEIIASSLSGLFFAVWISIWTYQHLKKIKKNESRNDRF